MLTLIIGGARSGKSELALRLARASGRDVLFVATMQAGDEETRDRIARHRAERPDHWRTVEAPLDPLEAARHDARGGEFVVIDCVTLWATNVLLARLPGGDEGIAPADASEATEFVRAHADALGAWAASFDGEVAVVTNEVGGGIVPAYALGRVFRDAMGVANAALASRAGRVYSVVAGLAVELRALGATPVSSAGGDSRL